MVSHRSSCSDNYHLSRPTNLVLRPSHTAMIGHGSTLLLCSVVVCLWLNVGLPPRFPWVVKYHWPEIESFSVTLTHDGLEDCDRPAKLNQGHREDRQCVTSIVPLNYSDWLIPAPLYLPLLKKALIMKQKLIMEMEYTIRVTQITEKDE